MSYEATYKILASYDEQLAQEVELSKFIKRKANHVFLRENRQKCYILAINR